MLTSVKDGSFSVSGVEEKCFL